MSSRLHLCRTPLPPGLGGQRQPHCPSRGSVCRGLGGRALAAWPLRGSGLPPPFPAEHQTFAGPGHCWGFSLPCQGKSLSLHVSDRLPGDRVLREGGHRAGPAGGPRAHTHTAWCPAHRSPARLFCALVTHERPLPGPPSVPDTPWGLPAKLLALRLLQCWARHPGTGLGWPGSPAPPLAHLHTRTPGARAPRSLGSAWPPSGRGSMDRLVATGRASVPR